MRLATSAVDEHQRISAARPRATPCRQSPGRLRDRQQLPPEYSGDHGGSHRSPPAANPVSSQGHHNRDRGESRDSSPPTPPYIRVRLRRFARLSTDGLFASRARGSIVDFRVLASALRAAPSGLHPFPPFRRPVTWIFCRMASSRFPHPSVFPAFRPSAKLVPPTTPSADFSAAITSLTTRSVRCPGHDGDLPR